VAVASAGTYASLHLAPGRQPCQRPTTQIFLRLDALPAASVILVMELILVIVLVSFQTNNFYII